VADYINLSQFSLNHLQKAFEEKNFPYLQTIQAVFLFIAKMGCTAIVITASMGLRRATIASLTAINGAQKKL
jgi:hypothetical protein